LDPADPLDPKDRWDLSHRPVFPLDPADPLDQKHRWDPTHPDILSVPTDPLDLLYPLLRSFRSFPLDPADQLDHSLHPVILEHLADPLDPSHRLVFLVCLADPLDPLFRPFLSVPSVPSHHPVFLVCLAVLSVLSVLSHHPLLVTPPNTHVPSSFHSRSPRGTFIYTDIDFSTEVRGQSACKVAPAIHHRACEYWPPYVVAINICRRRER